MNYWIKFIAYPFLLLIFLPYSSIEIKSMLNNDRNPSEMVAGAQKAAMSRDTQYVPLLLKNAYLPYRNSDIRYKGISVNMETTYALQEILHAKPPHEYWGIAYQPDSINIKFYTAIWKNMHR